MPHKIRTRVRCQPWGGQAGCAVGTHAPKSYRNRNGAQSLARQPLLGGASGIMDTIRADQVVETALKGANATLSQMLKGDIIALKAPMRQPVDEIVRAEIEYLAKTRRTPQRNKLGKLVKPPAVNKLVVMLETTGGFIEVVERLALSFRNHYKTVEFIVPNYAYSAGTVLVMSGDEIYMDYFSILGPIDPQYPEDGDYLPGMGYLAKFNELLKAINEDKTGDNTRAELALLLKKFSPAKIFDIEQAVEHSKALLEDWLPKYKFKSWKTKETSGKAVTPKDRRERAIEVAKALGDANHWHSHGRGITIRDLESEKIKLKVKDFGDDSDLNTQIRHYHGLFVDYMKKQRMTAAVHCGRSIRRIA